MRALVIVGLVGLTASPMLTSLTAQSAHVSTEGSVADFLAHQEPMGPPDTPPVDVNDVVLGDSVTLAAALESFRGYYRYRARGFDHREQVFRWQFISSFVIFAVVNLLVIIGLYFSWLQFQRTMPVGSPGLADDALQAERGSAATALHHLSISSSGVKVSSPVLGVVILLLSFAFYYLYLVYVYPVKEIW